MTGSRISAGPVPLPARIFGYLALASALFTIYGSLVPFKYQSLSKRDAVTRLKQIVRAGLVIDSKSDVLANTILGMPIGFCLMAFRRLDRARSLTDDVITASWVWPGCVLFATGVEAAQIFFHGRYASISDVLAQSVGSSFGIFVWLLMGPKLIRWFRGVWTSTRIGGTNGRVLIAFTTVLFLVQLLPLDLTLSPADLYHKIRLGNVTFIPFGELFGPNAIPVWQKVQNWLEIGTFFVLMGLLSAGVPSISEGGIRRVAVLGLVLALTIESMQLLVQSRHASITDVVVGTIAVVCGWIFGQVAFLGRGVIGLSFESTLILLQGWLMTMVLMNWQPFDFDSSLMSERWHNIQWIPFADSSEKNYLSSLEEALAKTILYTPLGAIIASFDFFRYRNRKPIHAAIYGILIATLIEAGQMLLPSRYPGSTDLIFGAVGAWSGAVITHRLRCATPEAQALERWNPQVSEPVPMATPAPRLTSPSAQDAIRVELKSDGEGDTGFSR